MKRTSRWDTSCGRATVDRYSTGSVGCCGAQHIPAIQFFPAWHLYQVRPFIGAGRANCADVNGLARQFIQVTTMAPLPCTRQCAAVHRPAGQLQSRVRVRYSQGAGPLRRRTGIRRDQFLAGCSRPIRRDAARELEGSIVGIRQGLRAATQSAGLPRGIDVWGLGAAVVRSSFRLGGSSSCTQRWVTVVAHCGWLSFAVVEAARSSTSATTAVVQWLFETGRQHLP